MNMIIELLNRRDPLRILLALYQRGGLRFGQIQTLLDLNPTQVNRALKFLTSSRWIKTHPQPGGKSREQAEYRLEKSGDALAEAFTSFTAAIQQKKEDIGAAELAEFQKFWLPTLSAGKKVIHGKSGNSVTIRQFPRDEKEELAEYRAGCMMLPPKRRVSRVMELSRRLALLNNANPRAPHIAPQVRITHDAFK
jgi:DNA-binding HxlR family transcriptional regulator